MGVLHDQMAVFRFSGPDFVADIESWRKALPAKVRYKGRS